MRFLIALLLACSPSPGSRDRVPDGTDPTNPTDPVVTEPTVTVPAPDPWLEIGDGEFEHVPCDVGQNTPVYFREQSGSGFHVAVSAQVWHVGSIVWVGADVFLDGAPIGGFPDKALQLAEFDEPRQTGWFAGEEAQIDEFDLGCALEGRTIEVCPWAESIYDRTVAAQACIEMVARLTPGAIAACAP